MLDANHYLASYNKAENDIAEDFYLPSMRASCKYDRISGYFGSTVYIIAWPALKEFINNNGKMRIVCSPYVSEADAVALSEGYSARTDEILNRAIEQEVQSLLESDDLSAPAKLLAYLVSKGIVDIKIAVPTGTETAAAKRMFHDKVGIFYDESGNAVGFRGSMNETFNGLSSDGNIESIDVFPNWMDDRDRERVENAQEFFDKLWGHELPGIIVYPFPSASKELLRHKSEGIEWEQLLEEIKVTETVSDKWRPNHQKGGKKPRKHQANALEAWVQNGRRGIFEHATGSGKTFTAMCAINDALSRNEVVLVLVPSRDLLKQWDKELHATLTDYKVHYLLCGDSNSEWKKGNKLHSWTTKGNGTKRIISATMDTAYSDEFVHKISSGDHLFVVVDELHRLGSPKRRRALRIQAGPRLGLSATPYRYGDPEGTQALFDYFGGLIPPPFTLRDAINSGVLTRYFYHPEKIYLTNSEQEDWNSITKEIQILVARISTGESNTIDINGNPKLKQLLIKRARIVKNAAGKVPLAIRIIKEKYRPGDKWIIYCDNITQLQAVLNNALDAGFDAYEYYAEMKGDRDTTLAYFAANGGVLVSIKCLDEGVDIPATTHALILASSQNPREFIQRRGRILRRSPGKHFAHLYDAVAIPIVEDSEDDKSLSIITAELSRAIQFGEGAENLACVTDLKNIAIDFNIDFNALNNGGFEDDDE